MRAFDRLQRSCEKKTKQNKTKTRHSNNTGFIYKSLPYVSPLSIALLSPSEARSHNQ